MTTRTSVALCTYNGARYLPDFLVSLTRQTRPPDEVVALDDGSSDGSVALLRQLATTAPFPVRIEVNERRHGVTANFDRCVGLCSGDLIALADQDDVWRPEKLRRLVEELERDPGVGLVFTDADLADAELRPLGRGLWEVIGFRPGEQRRIESADGFAILLRRPVVTGATAVFRSRFRGLISPIPDSWVHDGWIAFLIAAVDRIRALPERLMLYRQHGDNQIGTPATLWRRLARADRLRSREAIARTARALEDARKRLSAPGVVVNDARTTQLIDEALGHNQARATLPLSRWRRVPVVVREAFSGRYRRYSDGVLRVVQDLVL